MRELAIVFTALIGLQGCSGDDTSAPHDASVADVSADVGVDSGRPDCAVFDFVVTGTKCNGAGSCGTIPCSCAGGGADQSCTNDGCVIGASCAAFCDASFDDWSFCTRVHRVGTVDAGSDAADAADAPSDG